MKIENGSCGFFANLEGRDRFSKDHDRIGDIKRDGSIAINIRGVAGGTGSLYTLYFRPK